MPARSIPRSFANRRASGDARTRPRLRGRRQRRHRRRGRRQSLLDGRRGRLLWHIVQRLFDRVGDQGHALADGRRLAGLHQDAAKIASAKRLNVAGRLVGLDDENRLAGVDPVPFFHKPLGDDNVIAGGPHARNNNPGNHFPLSFRTGGGITVALRKGTVPFSSDENWDSPVIDPPVLTRLACPAGS